jgi:hypothetical protein
VIDGGGDEVDQKKKKIARIRSVRNWLGRAEKGLEAGNELEGQMNFLLAEAEMSLLQSKKTKDWKRARHLFALCSALAIVGIVWGFAGSFGASTEEVLIKREKVFLENSFTSIIENAMIEQKSNKNEIVVDTSETERILRGASSQEIAESGGSSQKINAGVEPVVSRAEMEGWIRTAGASIRKTQGDSQ